MRADLGLLLTIALVVVLTSMLTSAVSPLGERTSDRAVYVAVRDARLNTDVVATIPVPARDGVRVRDPLAAEQLRDRSDTARQLMSRPLVSVVGPGVTTLSTRDLSLTDAGPGRFLRLAYLQTPQGSPAVTYTSGTAPGASVPPDRTDELVDVEPDERWVVQVALSEAAATSLGLATGDRLTALDAQQAGVEVLVSGVFEPTDPAQDTWQAVPGILRAVDGGVYTSATALVSTDALPDLQLAVPSDDLVHRVVFAPRPGQVRWRQAPALIQAVASMKASSGPTSGAISWDSALDQVLGETLTQVDAARGQAAVLVVGLLGSSLLVLVLAAALLVRRRSNDLYLSRARGVSVVGIGAELATEGLVLAGTSTALGLLVTRLTVGQVAWLAALPVLVVAALAAPVLAMLAVTRSAGARRVPANRSARHTALRGRRTQRLLLEAAVVVTAALALVALRQRGVVGGGTDLTAATAPTWWAVAGCLLVLRTLPPTTRLLLSRARRSTGGTALFTAARAAETTPRALPLLVVAVAVAQLSLGVCLAATERQGQSLGALADVGADARLETAPATSVDELARRVVDAPGVSAAVAARVTEAVPVSSLRAVGTARLVVVDAAAYESLLARGPLPDAPQLARLEGPPVSGGTTDRVPALMLGGDAELRDGLQVRWNGDTLVPLSVVGPAPRVGGGEGPVIVVDAAAFAATGAVADPGTVWVLGAGSAAAVRAVAGRTDRVDVLSEVVAARRQAPLASGLVHLAVASSVLLLSIAGLGVALAAASEAPSRTESLGRLRSLGLRHAQLRRVLAGELVVPVLVAALAGLGLGIAAALTMFGSLSLELVTGQASNPQLVVPWWTIGPPVALVVVVLMITQVEAARIRRTPLAALLRGGTAAG